ncbi:MAG: OmpA family protein [Verrucomicrobiae bacterium]|nr:OmpA family protein [Verrucomicrobiae bacterium]
MKRLDLSLSCVIGAAVALALSGCKSAQPYAGVDGATGGEVDYTAMQSLPERGNFNPDTDVDYGTLRAPDMNCGIIFFETDSSTIGGSERAKLEKVAGWMAKHPDKQILVAGHTDERGSLGYNRSLGERRSIAVRDYLLGLGAGRDRVYTHSYGEERPAAQGASESAYAKNRRAEIGIVVAKR